MSEPVLEAHGLGRRFWDGAREIEVLRAISLTVRPGDLVAVTGASGSGKSTLLHQLGGLDHPTTGTVSVEGRDLFRLSERQRGAVRNCCLGFVYQFHHLMPEFDALENVMMPLLIRRLSRARAAQWAQQTLQRVELGERLRHRPSELSGGERQRTAIARALVTQPKLVLSDEPTGNLDPRTAARIHDLIFALNQEMGTAWVVATHDSTLAARMPRRYQLEEGGLVAR